MFGCVPLNWLWITSIKDVILETFVASFLCLTNLNGLIYIALNAFCVMLMELCNAISIMSN